MKHRKNEPPKIPPDKKLKYQFLHTAVSKGIAVFFCSTPFYLFSPYRLIYGSPLQNDAPAVKWVHFLFVIKRRFLLCRGTFCNRRQTEVVTQFLISDKPCFADDQGGSAILSKWQTFIGRYP